VRYSLIVRRSGKEMDDDRVISGCHGARDALFAARRVKHCRLDLTGKFDVGWHMEAGRMTLDDSPRWVTLAGVTQEMGSVWRRAEQVIFVVEECA
jgi:hypothetical protein